MNIQFSAQITKVESKVDRTLNVKMNTQELGKEDAGSLYDYSGKQIWCALAEVPLKPENIEIPEKVLEVGDKSPSQRLRAVIYLLAKQEGIEDTDAFYRKHMEKIIDYIKDKLN